MLSNQSRIKQIISLIDLTNLNENCDEKAIESLCRQASTPVGPVAAVCIWPRFITTAKHLLGDRTAVKMATVVNFPSGEDPLPTVCTAIENSLRDGVDEIDYVLPYASLLQDRTKQVMETLREIRSAVPQHIHLKVILETGKLVTSELIRTAASMSIDAGADFIKTSTGKVSINATPEAARIMLETIASKNPNVGFKAAGGIKTVQEADDYLRIAETCLGQDWIEPAHFRFGASGLLDNALNPLTAGDSTGY